MRPAIPAMSLCLLFSCAPAMACQQTVGSAFELRGDTVLDTRSGLLWKRCAVGMSFNAKTGGCDGEPEGLTQETAAAAATKAGPGWRVPTGPELETLVLETCSGPKIDSTFFPNVEASDSGEGAKFWTTTELLPGMFYYFEFLEGYADAHSAGYGLSLFLVKKP